MVTRFDIKRQPQVGRKQLLEAQLAAARLEEGTTMAPRKTTEKERMLETNAAGDAELCHLPRLAPEPGNMSRRFFNILDVLRFLINAWILTFALMELDSRWNQGFDLWRIYIGIAAIYVSVETGAILAGILMGWRNERYLYEHILLALGKDSDADPTSAKFEQAKNAVIARVESEESAGGHITLPMMNTPTPRLGFVYHATLAIGWIVTWSYLYMELNSGDGINMVSFNDERGARVFVNLAALISGMDLLIAIIDYKGLLHVGLDMDTRKSRACADMHVSLAEGTAGYPGMMKLFAVLEPIEYLTNMSAVVIGYELVKQLTQGPSAFFGVITWRLIAGSMAGIISGIVFLHLIALVMTWKHSCAYRVTMDATMYWLAQWGIVGGVWLYMFRVSNDSTLSPQSFENYLWWLLFDVGAHIFYSVFHHLRCFISVVWQREFWPNLYGI